MTVSHLTSSYDELFRALVTKFSGSVTLNPLTMSTGQMLAAIATFVSTATSELTMGHGEMLAKINTALGGSGTALSKSPTQLMADIVNNGASQPETASLVARMSVAPTTARVTLLDTLIASLKSAGVWTKFDCLYVMAAHDAQAARLNWVQDAFNLTAVNSPTFLTDRYYQGNGSSSYLDSTFDPTTATTPDFTQNDAHIAFWALNSVLTAPIGSTNVTLVPSSGTNTTLRINAASGLSVANATATGYFSGVRRSSSAVEVYRNAVSLGSGSIASASPGAESLYIGARNQTADTFASTQIAIAHWGSQFSAGETLAAYNAFAAYLSAVGAV